MGFDLQSTQIIGRFTFEWDDDNDCYECRGAMMYDDEHDEMPEPALWNAAHELSAKLLNNGFHSEVNHSEKGWVEVSIIKKVEDG